jgi:hypothetical protein
MHGMIAAAAATIVRATVFDLQWACARFSAYSRCQQQLYCAVLSSSSMSAESTMNRTQVTDQVNRQEFQQMRDT